jgi:hypothetical protein
MTLTQMQNMAQQKSDEDLRRHKIAVHRYGTDGAAGLWGVNGIPQCHTCPLYVPKLNGTEGVCIRTNGSSETRKREDLGCSTHPEIQAVMNMRIEQATTEFVARKITGGE